MASQSSSSLMSLSLDPRPNGNYVYQFAVLHYIGHENLEERRECEDFVAEFKTRLDSKYGPGISVFTDWEAKIGHDIFDVVTEVGSESKYMVVILSPSFINDDYHLHKLKNVFKTLLGQRRLIPIAIRGVTPDGYTQLNFLNVITILKFTNDWRQGNDEKWSKLLRTVCNTDSPILTTPQSPQPIFQTARSPFGINRETGVLMDTDGRAGIDTKGNLRKEKYYEVIRNHATLIADIIEVNDFSSYLIQERVFSIDQLQDVTCERTRLKRAQAFIEKLSGKSAQQIYAAVESMKRTYGHVHGPLMKEFQRVDWDLSQEDGSQHHHGSRDNFESAGRHPVQDSSLRNVHPQAQPMQTYPDPSAPSLSSQMSMQSQPGPHYPSRQGYMSDSLDNQRHQSYGAAGGLPSQFPSTQQAPGSLPPALDQQSIEIINAEIARLEAMKQQMMALQAAQSRTSLPSAVSPIHPVSRSPPPPVQPLPNLPPVTAQNQHSSIPQSMLPFSPTDEDSYRMIAHPSSFASSMHSHPENETTVKTVENQEGSAFSFRSSQASTGQASNLHGASHSGYPTNPNPPAQPTDQSTTITTGVRDMTIGERGDTARIHHPHQDDITEQSSMPSDNLSLHLSVTGGDVRN